MVHAASRRTHGHVLAARRLEIICIRAPPNSSRRSSSNAIPKRLCTARSSAPGAWSRRRTAVNRSGAHDYLLPSAAGIISRWHRVTSDEVWHLYEGGPLEVLSVDPEFTTLSRHKLEQHTPVCTVAASHWQAARTLSDYALVRCTVAPGSDFEDFTIVGNDAQAPCRCSRSIRSRVAGLNQGAQSLPGTRRIRLIRYCRCARSVQRTRHSAPAFSPTTRFPSNRMVDGKPACIRTPP